MPNKMTVINLFGGPGSGKSTSSAALFADLKNHGINTELVGEEAKDQIYWGSPNQLENQFLLAAMQYARLKNLQRAGCRIAISDSPLIQNPMYCRDHHYYAELVALVNKVNDEFDNVYVYINRTKDYSPFGRVQSTVEEAQEIDRKIQTHYHFLFDITVTGDANGQKALCEWVREKLVQRPANVTMRK